MIPPLNEFPVECTCTFCGKDGVHWVNFIEWFILTHNVIASVECDNCANEYEIAISDFDFENLQPEELHFPNPN